MKRFALWSCLLLTVFAVAPAHASGARHSDQTRWSQRDTAVYVVSTLNLLYRSDGQSVPALLRSMGAVRYDIFADLNNANLYFIVARGHRGPAIAAFAYRIGWLKPQCLDSAAAKFGMNQIRGDLVQMYRQDHKQLIGSFRSTVP